MLSGYGIDATAESVYIAVLDNSDIDVMKLANIMGLGETSVRKALGRLVELGLVTCDEESDRCVAVEPEISMAALLARQQRELTRHQQQVEDTRLTVAHILTEYGRGKPGSLFGAEWVVGGTAVGGYVSRLTGKCREEYLSLQPNGRLAGSMVHRFGHVDDLLARGVELRSIVLSSTRNHRATLAYLLRQIEHGVHIRTLPTLPAWIQIFDRRYATVSVGNIAGVEGMLVVRCEAIVHSFFTLFSKLWAEAEPFGGRRVPRNGALSPQEKQILKLWAQGYTDASAARQMDVSLRTVRRLSDRLTERLKTHSRFQLGAAAWHTG